MNPKTLILLFALLALMAGAYFLLPGNRPQTDYGVNQALRRGNRVFSGFGVEDARSIEIEQNDVKIRLQKSDADHWVVASKEDRRVYTPKLEKLLEAIKLARVEEVRQGPLDKFALDPASRIKLRVLGDHDKELAATQIGSSPQFGACFVRSAQGDAVLEIQPDLEGLVGTRTQDDRRLIHLDHWYDLTILRFNRDDVKGFEVQRGVKTVRVERLALELKKEVDEAAAGKEGKEGEGEKDKQVQKEKWIWQVSQPENVEANQSACKTLCSTASILHAIGYADDINPRELELDPPRARTTIMLEAGTSYTLLFGKVKTDFAVMQLEGRPEIWKVERYNYDGLVKTFAELKKEEALPRVETLTPKKEPGRPNEAPPPPAPPQETIPAIPKNVKEQPSPAAPKPVEP